MRGFVLGVVAILIVGVLAAALYLPFGNLPVAVVDRPCPLNGVSLKSSCMPASSGSIHRHAVSDKRKPQPRKSA